MEEMYKQAKDLVTKYNQQHLLNKYNDLTKEKKEELLKQILSIDFDEMEKLYEQAKSEVKFDKIKIEPADYVDKSKLTEKEKEYYIQKGIEIMKKNKYAVVTMAGGQGTRLGHNGPKGSFDLGLDSHKCIFEILCDTLKEAKEKYNVTIPWHLMTSRENNEQTVKFFESKNYFGYPKESVKFFKQGELPMLSKDGKILLQEDYLVKEAADGHGGILKAMLKNNIIEEMKQNGIEWVFIIGVDNVLAKLADPLLLGLTSEKKVLAAVKSVEKTNPKEKVGVFCKKNGRTGVVEYTEIPEEMAEQRNPDGSLVYGDLNAVFHLYNIKALEKILELKLPYHTAVKKATYIDENGKLIVPEEPNAYKFETFIFDSFEMFDDVVILRVKREEEFAPVKNKEGQDSPETARKLYENYYKNYARR